MSWKIFGLDVVSPGHNDRPFHNVFQFTNVPFPPVADKKIHGCRCEPLYQLTVSLREDPQEMLRKEGDVLPAIPKGR